MINGIPLNDPHLILTNNLQGIRGLLHHGKRKLIPGNELLFTASIQIQLKITCDTVYLLCRAYYVLIDELYLAIDNIELQPESFESKVAESTNLTSAHPFPYYLPLYQKGVGVRIDNSDAPRDRWLADKLDEIVAARAEATQVRSNIDRIIDTLRLI